MEELVTKIYRALGFDDKIIPYDIVHSYVSDWSSVYPDSDCLAMHNAVVSCYEWLIRQAAVTGSGGGSRSESNGKRSISVTGYNKGIDWGRALDDYLSHPWYAFPTCRSTLSNTSGGLGKVIVGGVREDQISKVVDDNNMRDGGASEYYGVKSESNSSTDTVNKGFINRFIKYR